MPRRARQLSDSGVYHVMLRGINRQAIFFDDEDRQRFLSNLTTAKQASGCYVLAYCLMTNHVHLVLRTTEETIGQVMKRLGVRYARWVSRKYERVGHLFQDRFKSFPVDDDAYLLTLLSYVWNNPVEAGLTARPDQYAWSSCRHIADSDAVIDQQELLRLVPVDTLVEIIERPSHAALDEQPRVGRPPRFTDGEAADLLQGLCGARNANEFRQLEPTQQRLATFEILGRGVPLEQAARLTGRSATSIRRMRDAAAGELHPRSVA